jgi:hypothetical protein
MMVLTSVGASCIQVLGRIGKADHEITEKSLSSKVRNRLVRGRGGLEGGPFQGLQALSVGRTAGGLSGNEGHRNIIKL